MARFGFCGPTYAQRSGDVDASRCINLIPEVLQDPGGYPKAPIPMYGAPGLVEFATCGIGPITGMYFENDRLFVVSGVEFYEVDSVGTATLRGSLANFQNLPATIHSNGSAANQLFIVTESKGYIYNLTTNALTQITDSAFPTSARHGAFTSGFFVVSRQDSTKFQSSALLDGTSWEGTAIGQKLDTPDNIERLEVFNKEVWLIGSRTTEIWYNTGNATFPFAPVPGGVVEIGTGAPDSVAIVDQSLFMIAANEDGASFAVRMNGPSPQRISNHAVETAWSQYDTRADAVGWGYSENGHTFWVVWFPYADATWAYDISTGMWHERAYWNEAEGVYEAHLGRCHTSAFGRNVIGSRKNGKLYTMSLDVYTDAGNTIRRLRRSPHIADEDRRINHVSMTLDLETGIGLTSGQGSDPQLMLRWSSDSGKTWSNEHWRSAGAIGAYGQRAEWRRLGRARDRIYELVVTDPVKWAIVDAYLTLR